MNNAPGHDTFGDAKRAVLTLSAAQAIVGAAAPIAISLGGLTGHYLLGADKTLATMPVTGFNIGVAIGALPAAWLMRWVGRRHGFATGSLITALGGAFAVLSILQGSFLFFAVALAVVGIGGAFVQQYRFAAADMSPKSFKPQAISWVLGGGVFAAIIGPQAVIWTSDLFAPIEFAGAFLSVIVLGLVGAAILWTLRVVKQADEQEAAEQGEGRPLSKIVAQPKFLLSFFCAVVTYALMAFLMTGAPLAMVGCGHSTDQAALGISWHVIAMFAPSFFTGKLIARFGKETIVMSGLVLLIICALISLSGTQLWQFWFALILLGVGWNFGFIGATAMLTDCYEQCEKNKVQGAHDFVLFSTVAIASLLSGATLNMGGDTMEQGWNALNWASLPLSAFCLVLLLAYNLRAKRAASAAG